MRKNLKPLRRYLERNNDLKLELKTLKEKLENCEDQNRVNQKRLSEENQEVTSYFQNLI